jgi:predicted O-linked N-acetylglucosamine transferase (SPINDLY family)
LENALSLAPGEPLLHVNLASVHIDLRRYAEAAKNANDAIGLAPESPHAWINLAAALHKLQRLNDAETAARKALTLAGTMPQAWEILGEVFVRQHKLPEAEAAFKQSLQLNPRSAKAWLSLGETYDQCSQYALAEKAFRQASELDSLSAASWFKLGLALKDQKQYEEALTHLDKAHAIDPNLDCLLSWRLMTRAMVCDWSNRKQDIDRLTHSLRAGEALAIPFHLLAIKDDPDLQLLAAQLYTLREHPGTSAREAHRVQDGSRIRVGYFSADFRDHPVAQLIAETLEQHDRSRFEVFGLSLAPANDSKIGRRICHAFEHFVHLHGVPDAEAIRKIRDLRLDIAINLNGYTAGHRTNLFAARLAPVQVSHLGFAGTMGADYIDYLITDEVVCPPGCEMGYTEKLARLPACFMPHDGQQAVAEVCPTRAESGLPEKGFVFCCFNNHYKINPEIFDVWMRLLHRVEGAVLWLSDGPELLKKNLRREALSRGVDPDRLVFAKRVDDMEHHLARYRLADLFVDTVPYNAHTTACDSLWAGVPVLTCPGRSFASRVAASLLSTAGLSELAADSLEMYEDLAVNLAGDPSRLENIRRALRVKRHTGDLFDTKKLTRDTESLLTLMHRRMIDGLPADHIGLGQTA